MKLAFSPLQASALVDELIQYDKLLRLYKFYSHRNSCPAIPTRIRLKELENQLPPRVVQFCRLFRKHAHQFGNQIAISAKSTCPQCNSTRAIEWYPDDAGVPYVVTCANCDLLLFLNLGVFDTKRSPQCSTER